MVFTVHQHTALELEEKIFINAAEVLLALRGVLVLRVRFCVRMACLFWCMVTRWGVLCADDEAAVQRVWRRLLIVQLGR